MRKDVERPGFVNLSHDAVRQYLDAESAFSAYEMAVAEAALVRGGMYWHKAAANSSKADAYLIRTDPTGSQTSLGARSRKTELIYASFRRRKETARERLRVLREVMLRHQRMNRALRVGRVAPMTTDLLNQLASSTLAGHFRVVDTYALYAYEAAAGVLFGNRLGGNGSSLWDVSERMTLVLALNIVNSFLAGVLQKVDSTFRMSRTRRDVWVNNDGFEITILHPERPVGRARIGRPEEVQIMEVVELLGCAPFTAMVVATNGVMARMPTIDPMAFVRFKQLMSLRPGRDPFTCRRDALQAAAVEALATEYLPQFKAADSRVQVAR